MTDTPNAGVSRSGDIAGRFYRGFNAPVSIIAKLAILGLLVMLLLQPALVRRTFDLLADLMPGFIDAWYAWLMAGIVVTCAVLTLLPASGRIRLGGPDQRPEFSRLSWLGMLFFAGSGTGLLAFSVSEPVSHFMVTPDSLFGTIPAQTEEGAINALRYAFLHWGFSAWACYAIVGLSFALAAPKTDHPLTLKSAFSNVFGRLAHGMTGHVLDVLTILAIFAGVTVSIVIGVEQIGAGLARLAGVSVSHTPTGSLPLFTFVAILMLICVIALPALVKGVVGGINRLANIGTGLVFVLFVVVLAFADIGTLVGFFAKATWFYLVSFPQLSVEVHETAISGPMRERAHWQTYWTTFYRAWWIAFSPFVGMFLARISRGRTAREFILGAIIAPIVLCFFWFTIIGGSALSLELDGRAAGTLLTADPSERFYLLLETLFPAGLAQVMTLLVIALFIVFTVISFKTATFVIKSICATDDFLSRGCAHTLIWAGLLILSAGVLIVSGGTETMRVLIILCAFPFSAVIGLMVPALIPLWLRAAGQVPSELHRRPQP